MVNKRETRLNGGSKLINDLCLMTFSQKNGSMKTFMLTYNCMHSAKQFVEIKSLTSGTILQIIKQIITKSSNS